MVCRLRHRHFPIFAIRHLLLLTSACSFLRLPCTVAAQCPSFSWNLTSGLTSLAQELRIPVRLQPRAGRSPTKPSIVEHESVVLKLHSDSPNGSKRCSSVAAVLQEQPRDPPLAHSHCCRKLSHQVAKASKGANQGENFTRSTRRLPTKCRQNEHGTVYDQLVHQPTWLLRVKMDWRASCDWQVFYKVRSPATSPESPAQCPNSCSST